MNSSQLDLPVILDKLLHVSIPDEMLPWTVLANRLAELQRNQTLNDNDMRYHIACVHELEKKRAQYVSIEKIFTDSMEAVLPPGGEKLWEDL